MVLIAVYLHKAFLDSYGDRPEILRGLIKATTVFIAKTMMQEEQSSSISWLRQAPVDIELERYKVTDRWWMRLLSKSTL